MTEVRARALRELRSIPWVGPRTAEDLYRLGFRSVDSLRDQDPEDMYLRLCDANGVVVDRCMLYVFRCAVYYASNDTHDPDRLQWWRWKDSQ